MRSKKEYVPGMTVPTLSRKSSKSPAQNQRTDSLGKEVHCKLTLQANISYQPILYTNKHCIPTNIVYQPTLYTNQYCTLALHANQHCTPTNIAYQMTRHTYRHCVRSDSVPTVEKIVLRGPDQNQKRYLWNLNTKTKARSHEVLDDRAKRKCVEAKCALPSKRSHSQVQPNKEKGSV